MAQAATAFGVFVGILSVYNTFKDPATPPGGPAHQNSFVVSMEAGQDHGVELIGAAGMRPTVELWDLNGDPIGVNSESEMIDTARNIKFFVDPVSKEKQGVDPVYLTLRARGTDPVCLTELTVSNPLSGRQYAFAAAMAKGCGGPWVRPSFFFANSICMCSAWAWHTALFLYQGIYPLHKTMVCRQA